jgi:hypothetical protein
MRLRRPCAENVAPAPFSADDPGRRRATVGEYRA